MFFLFFCSDINECATGTHKCSADAVCNNTKGSYNCTCKAGFLGDGWDCQGESVIHRGSDDFRNTELLGNRFRATLTYTYLYHNQQEWITRVKTDLRDLNETFWLSTVFVEMQSSRNHDVALKLHTLAEDSLAFCF